MTTNTKAHQTVGSIPLEDPNTALFPKVKDAKVTAQIIKRTRYWTAKNPFLTQVIYRYIRQYSAQIIHTEGAANIVDEVVYQKIIKNWKSNEAAELLIQIERALHRFKCQDTLMVLYLQILWRGGIAADDQPKLSAEQNALIQSKLVTINKSQLQLTNRIYATVFNLNWIEQQIPGLTTRTVSFPTSAKIAKRDADKKEKDTAPENAEAAYLPSTSLPNTNPPTPTSQVTAPTKLSKTLSAATLVASGVALLGVGLMAYFQAPNNFGAVAEPVLSNKSIQDGQETIAVADLSTNAQVPSANSTLASTSINEQAASISQISSSKALFDQGLAHATNGRWLPMAQQFCSIPPESGYFAPAKSQLKRWTALYPQDIQQANNDFTSTQNTVCPMLEEALSAAK